VYDDPAQAPHIMKRLQFLGATWVKSYENLDLGVPPPGSVGRDHVFNRAIDWDAVDRRRMDIIRGASVEHRLALTPTLNTATVVLDLERYQEARREPTARALPSFYSAVVWHPAKGIPAYRNIGKEDFDRLRRAVERKRELVSQLHRDGVTLLLGTDTEQPFVAPGVALHREFDAFDQAGIPRRDSFRLATATAATVLGLTNVGNVAEGRPRRAHRQSHGPAPITLVGPAGSGSNQRARSACDRGGSRHGDSQGAGAVRKQVR
jgi:hypothetical protein